MRTDSTIYRAIAAKIVLQGMTGKEIANQMGISYSSFHNKMCGTTPFTLGEAIRLKRILGCEESVEALFQPIKGVQPL